MTTITIENGKKLSRSVFDTFEDLIDEYYESKGMILLRQIDMESLTESQQQSIIDSQKKGGTDLENFQG